MKVWTIQTEAAWHRFQSTGLLRTDAAFIEPIFVEAYQWLVKQMTRRLAPAPPGVACPVWVWSQWDSAHKPRPDLRHAAHLPRGEQGVLLTCECQPATVLLSNFDLWHFVLNNWYLPSDQADEQAFLADCASPTVSVNGCSQKKADSWQRIFDLDGSDPDEEYTAQRAHKSIQGTLWELKLDQVKSTQHFVAR